MVSSEMCRTIRHNDISIVLDNLLNAPEELIAEGLHYTARAKTKLSYCYMGAGIQRYLTGKT